MSDFKKFVIIPENEYKSLISKVGSLHVSSQSESITEYPVSSISAEPQPRDLKLEEEKEKKKKKSEEAEEEEEKEEEVEKAKEEEEDKKVEEVNDPVVVPPTPTKRRRKGTSVAKGKSTRNDSSSHRGQDNFALLISVFEEYFAKKYHDRIIRLLRRLNATDQLKVKLSGDKNEVKGVNLGSHSYTLLRFIDLIELCALSRRKPEKTAEYSSFFNFINDYDIPKHMLYNPYVKNSSLYDSVEVSSKRPKGQKKKPKGFPSPQSPAGVKWFTSERHVPDSD